MAWSAVDLTLAIAILAVGAALQGSVGFGQNLMAAPIVALIEPDMVPGGLLISAVTINVLVSIRERDHFDLGEVSPALVGRIPGVVVGAVAAASLSTDGLGVILGASVLLMAALSAGGLRIRRTIATKAGAGLLSGFGATAVGIGGPPMGLLYANVDGRRLRSTLATFFLVGTAISICALAVVGEFGRRELELGLPVAPGVVLGFAASGKLTPLLDRGYTRPVVLGVSAASSVLVLVRSLF